MIRNRVAVIDDDPIVLEVVRERLESAGFEVITHDRPLGISKLILEHDPEVVLLDVMMPGLSGRRLIELITRPRRFKDLCVILHSSKASHELLDLIHQTGADGAIEKTHDPDHFLDRFTHLLGRMRSRSIRFFRSGAL